MFANDLRRNRNARRLAGMATVALAACLTVALANQSAFGALAGLLWTMAPSSGGPFEQEEKPLEEADPSLRSLKLAGERWRLRRTSDSRISGAFSGRRFLIGMSNRPLAVYLAASDRHANSQQRNGIGVPLLC